MFVVGIIQARMSSTRFPGKVLKTLCGNPLIWHVVRRVRSSQLIDEIVIATTKSKSDDVLVEWCQLNGIKYFRGPEDDVLARFYYSAKENNAEVIVRITADDPFKDPILIDSCIDLLKSKGYDFVCNNNPATFPEGLDVEVMIYEALKYSHENSVSDFEREHVTQYIHRNPSQFKVHNVLNVEDFSRYRWTIDTLEDFIFVKRIYEELYVEDRLFTSMEIYRLLDDNPNLLKINQDVKRSAMFTNIKPDNEENHRP